MIDSLKQERGQERMQANNASHRRADVAAIPRAFAPTAVANPPVRPTDSNNKDNKAFNLAREHRDRLLGYQAENARRTHIIDEAADYDTPSSGLSKWSSPLERAAQLKRQQQVLREQEWSARPEYEKRKVVVSVDLVGGKVVKRMAAAERPEDLARDEVDASASASSSNTPGLNGTGTGNKDSNSNSGDKGTFSQNPLLGNLIRPVWRQQQQQQQDTIGGGNDTNGLDETTTITLDTNEKASTSRPRGTAWRRVQDDDADDNEAWILDGGLYGGDTSERRLGVEEHAQAW